MANTKDYASKSNKAAQISIAREHYERRKELRLQQVWVEGRHAHSLPDEKGYWIKTQHRKPLTT